jgi:uncharacterized protein with ParB-like and HNH nuclease domain/predicted transport protein
VDAHDSRLTHLIDGQKQFIVPVFQRDYSWGTKHCLQLWQDIVRVGGNKSAKSHFVGSVVYIEAEETSASVTRWLVIDGQQRLTTLILLLSALRKRILLDNDTHGIADNDELPTPEAIKDSFLVNRHVRGDRRFKLHLRRTDHETLSALVEDKPPPELPSERIVENFQFFEEQLKDADLALVYGGIRKLVIIDVHLTRGQDDPQMIFESLNSTGLDLTQADLIRNFVLMRQDEELQTRLYEEYWYPIETAFGSKYRTEFDKFVRDYLTLKLRPSKQFKSDEIYRQFRIFFQSISALQTPDTILDEIRRFGTYYVGFSLGQENNEKLRESLQRLRALVEVASPLILQLYDFHSRAKTLSLEEFIKSAELIESYVFRRAVCDMQTRSLYQIFASLAYRIREAEPFLSLKTALYRQTKKRRFPTDTEFRESLETRDIYDMRPRHYLLDRLENDSKEHIDTTTLTIEHVLPQNEELRSEWKEMLGSDYRSIQERWQHRLGNLTLTGYNSEYSDLPFEQKKTLIDKEGRQVGFNFSPLRLNRFISEQSKWTQSEIEKRGRQLAIRAVSIWPSLSVDPTSVRAAELDELKENAAKYKIDDLEFAPETRALFDELNRQILSLGDDIVELAGLNTVTYRVFEFFVEIIPRKRRLALVLNLDFEETDDPSQRATDAAERAFVTHATESGGVLFMVDQTEDIEPAMHLVRQAYEKVSE